jgi:hypothetical protein
VSLIKTNRTTAGMAAMGARAKGAAAQAVPLGKRAGTTAVQGAVGAKDWAAPRVQDAKEWAAPRVQDAVRGAREWVAPRLEDAAEAVTTSVAPKVSSALRSTASQIRPAGTPAKTGVRRLLDWRWMLGVGAVLAAAGTTAAVTMRRRYARATADAKDATEPDATEQAAADDPAADASSVNGRVTTAGD